MEHKWTFMPKLWMLLVVVCGVSGLGVPELSSTKSKSQQDTHVEVEPHLKNGIVLIGLEDVAKDLSAYGILPAIEKDLINLFDANATLADKIVGDSRKFSFHAKNEANNDEVAAAQSSRLLPLVTTPKKALLLFALHQTFLKSDKGKQSNCVVLSKDDLDKFLNANMETKPMTP